MVWHEETEFEGNGHEFFLFEDHTASWVDSFITALDKGGPVLSSAPAEVLDHLRACRPHQMRERAWLVMYYSIILSMVSSSDPTNQSTKRKLRYNLWLALNDPRLFLEPSEANIQALTMLACHVEEFTTPTLCWMLATTACRMLQALGVNHRRLDPQTRERRVMMFWHLNLLDKALALIFGRPPTFHRAMSREIPLPTLAQLLSSQAQHNPTKAPRLFETHHFYQKLFLTRIMADIWNCLYEDAAPDHSRIEVVNQELESWYRQALQLLEAAALAEKPFLDARNAASIDLELHSLSFMYEYLRILLARSSSHMRTQCIESSKRMLHLLEHMVSESGELYNGIDWQLLCGSFTPFLELFGEIVSNGKGGSQETQDALAAMEQLPVFLGKMSSRNSLAAKLERIAVVFVQHAKSLMHPQGMLFIFAPWTSQQATNHTFWAEDQASNDAIDSRIPAAAWPDPWQSAGNMLHWDAFFTHAIAPAISGQPQVHENSVQTADLETWTSNFFGDAVFDWMGWDSQDFDFNLDGT
ncbi:hypothetical protein H2200_010475 [Cladophialophora chaetospira]|uniref:Xylanolytic transcriptional activator regulatory domain-containing protein n=1 Tax=Cladophialophora chaetospira TaxID=386627 RepID=A0AA38X1J0_9EURO|nr:hypothetical protein H2200_010475 [Cladophialophora chaetospira]